MKFLQEIIQEEVDKSFPSSSLKAREDFKMWVEGKKSEASTLWLRT